MLCLGGAGNTLFLYDGYSSSGNTLSVSGESRNGTSGTEQEKGGGKLGLNSEAITSSDLPEVLGRPQTGVGAVVDCCREGMVEVLLAPEMNGFADGFKEASLGPTENGGINLVGIGIGMTRSGAIFEWADR